MNTVEVSEEAYLTVLEENKKLKQQVDRYEMFIFGVLRQADKLLKEETE